MQTQETATVFIGTISAHGEVVRRDAKSTTVCVGATKLFTGREVARRQGIEGTVPATL